MQSFPAVKLKPFFNSIYRALAASTTDPTYLLFKLSVCKKSANQIKVGLKGFGAALKKKISNCGWIEAKQLSTII